MSVCKSRTAGTVCFIFALFALSGNTPSLSSFPVHPGVQSSFIISMADSVYGWAAGYVQTGGTAENGQIHQATQKTVLIPMILKTIDGGKNWKLQTILQTQDYGYTVRAVEAVDSLHCRILLTDENEEKNIFLFTDDGLQWSVTEFLIPDIVPKKMKFTGPKTGIVIAGDIFEEDRLYRTTDGGFSWHEMKTDFHGRIEFIDLLNGQIWLIAQTRQNPDGISIIRSDDSGKTWLLVRVLDPPKGEKYLPGGFLCQKQGMAVVIHLSDENGSEDGKSLLAYSQDQFLSHELFTVQYREQNKSGISHLSFPVIAHPYVYAFDRQLAEDITGDMSEVNYHYIIRTKDHGRSWEKINEIKSSVNGIHHGSSDVYISPTRSGMILQFKGSMFNAEEATVDFRGLFLSPGPVLTESLRGLDEDVPGDDPDEEHVYDTVMTSKWESLEDSLSAVSSSDLAKAGKYRPDITMPFSVGIDSVLSTTVQFHRRVRWGAKHVTWDLIKEEIKTGEIRIPRYKILFLKGSIHAAAGIQPKKYLWTSSINGELSDRLFFSTRYDQLSPGMHYVFFKAMDQSGNWTKPVVIKVIVEDFPKYKFPFFGRWTVGGGGSYYNRGRHTKGIKYALDLNYAEGTDGGDNDFGIPVRASTDGTVSFAGYTKGYGRNVRINYEYGGKIYTTLVSHLATISVSVGEKVKRGQELGTCGSTGRSSAPHIHWELRMNDICVPPEPIFENDSSVIQTLRDGWSYESDNFYEPDHIIVVDEPDIPGTWLEYKGYNHSFRWCGISSQKTVEAKWKPKLPRSGFYRLQVHIPRDHATATATYQIHTKTGVQEVKINQNKFTWEWATLGDFELDMHDDVYVSLDNSSSQRKGAVTFDAVRFIGLWNEEKK